MTIAGRQVRRLHEGYLPAGLHPLEWDARDEHSRRVLPGVYLARLEFEAGPPVSERLIVLER